MESKTEEAKKLHFEKFMHPGSVVQRDNISSTVHQQLVIFPIILQIHDTVC